MATKKIGTVIKEARTAAGLTQEQLARKVAGVTASELAKVERGEADFAQAELKALAKPLGVTQASLLNAPKNISAKPAAKPAASAKAGSAKTAAAKTSSAKTTSAKTSSAKTTSAKTSSAKTSTAKTSSAKTSSAKTAAKTTAAKTPKTPANANSTMKVTATERKLIEYYRTASADAKKAGTKVLKGECGKDILDSINSKNSAMNSVGDAVTDFIGGALSNLLGGKK